MTSLISIIVPVYKVEQYLDECVQSIVNQTYKNLEIILVDDGSPDRCPEMCDEWAKKDVRIKVIHKENGGASTARNAGLDIAKGDYIGFVDSDDYIHKDMYKIMLEAMNNTGKKMACCLPKRVHTGNAFCSDTDDPRIKLCDPKEALDLHFLKKVGEAVWCKLYERSVFKDLRFPEREINEEFPLIVPTVILSCGMVFVENRLYAYRIREDSITSTHTQSDFNLQVVLKNINLVKEQLEKNSLMQKKSFRFFAARVAFSSAIPMAKNYKHLAWSTKELFKKYRKLMLSNAGFYFCSKHSTFKDKILYFLVMTNTIQPVYKLLGKQ